MAFQRIVSKLGDLESFGASSRRVVYTGHDVDGIDEVDFAGKYDNATGKIKEQYQSFDLEYKGEENNDYVEGQGFCCTDNPLCRDVARTVSDTKDGETQKKLIYFYHSDHLGSYSLITYFDGEVTQHVEYIPYGEVFIEERNNVWNTPYLFNAKELDEEIGLYYYGARYYDNRISLWLSVDPKAEKYPNWSPYSYCYDNPLIFIDPDGQEGIVVSGQPGDHKNEEQFLVNGLDRAKTLQKQYKKEGNGEKATWFVYNSGGEGGYSKETIEKYQKLADKAGITMTVVSDADQIVDYVNDKTGGDSRANDLITNFTYVGHATPGDLDIGFEDHGTWNMMTNETLDVSDFNKEAFSKENSNANLVGGCRTSVKGDLPFERSVAEQMADKVSGTVKASSVRVYYPGGVVSDQQLVKKNNGTIVVIQGRNK